jgi:hypothetical protein
MAPVMCPILDSGATCTLTCKPGYVKSGDFMCSKGVWSAETCSEPEKYVAEEQLFRLSHRSRLDYGWKIRQVNVYSDEACTKKLAKNVISSYKASGSYAGYPPDSLFSGGSLQPETKCLEGKTPNTCKDWWSKGLNVNPYSVDETHGASTYLEFSVAAKESVQCVEVISRTKGPGGVARQYYPSEMTLHRGWSSNERKESDITMVDSIIDVDGWTEMWKTTADESMMDADKGLFSYFKTGCGKRATYIFGELLEGGEYSGVPSACHCKQLCVDKVDEGCRSWNYKPSSQDCYLQSTIKSMPEETCEAYSDWIAGDTGLRLTDFEPAVVMPGASFDLKVNGVNLPTEAGSKMQGTTPPRQRVKIVPTASACAEGEIAEHVEGIGCSHPYFCAPRPSASDIDSASWSGLKVQSSASAETYKVCYNRGFTYDRYEWHEVGTMEVKALNYVWTTDPPTLMRKTEDFDLTVEAQDAFDTTNSSHWKLKLIRSYFDCESVTSDPKFGDVSSAHLVMEERYGEWPDNYGIPKPLMGIWENLTVYSETTPVEVGQYKVCLNDGEAGSKYKQIPAKDGSVYLEIVAEEDYSTHPRKVFTYQTFSGKVDEENTFVLKGHRLRVPSTDKIALMDGACTEAAISTGAISEAKSTDDGYLFTMTLDDTVEVKRGAYSLCYCKAEDDATLDGTTAFTYSIKDTADKRCGSAPLTEADADGVVLRYQDLETAQKENLCTVKCARGCVGQECYCDSFTTDMYVETPNDAKIYPLCLSATGCRDACTAEGADCKGFDFDPEKNLCWLLSATDETECKDGKVADKEGAEYWVKNVGEACTHNADFSSKVGEVTLTKRVSIGNDWILTPGDPDGGSIEVLGADLNWKTDRIMYVDCTGICGISENPDLPVSYFSNWIPVKPDFVDPPHDDFEGPYQKPDDDASAEVLWRKKEGYYCPGNNMDVVGEERMDANRHQCYSKCVANAPCEGDDCNCEGLLQGYDGPTSQALCLTETQCKDVCAGIDDCYGIDMSSDEDVPRCFLNMKADQGSCEEYIINDQLTELKEYNFFYKQRADTGRRATSVEAAPERKLLAAKDMGKSWDEILRYKLDSVATGAQYKVCFCDRDTLPAGRFCKKASDFKIEIGTLHFSGVSCLIKEEKFQRGTCVAQFHGGLRCYPGPDKVPTITVPVVTKEAPPQKDVDEEVALDAALSAYCLYGPEEETRDDPMCP